MLVIGHSYQHPSGYDIRRKEIGIRTQPLHARDAEEVVQAVRHYFDMERHVNSPLACPLCRRRQNRITTRPTSKRGG